MATETSPPTTQHRKGDTTVSEKSHEVKKCKGCNAEIIWAITAKGKPTPLDAKPIRVALLADVEGGDPRIEDGVSGYVSHWGTCPARDEFKKKSGGEYKNN